MTEEVNTTRIIKLHISLHKLADAGVEIDESVELDGIIIDYTKEKKIASMEILDLKKRTKTDLFETINFVLMKGKVKI